MKTLQFKTFLTSWLLSSLLFLTGCSAWEEDTPAPENSRELLLVYQQLISTDVITRADQIQIEEELEIANLYAIFYKEDNTLAGISVTTVNKKEITSTVALNLPEGVDLANKYDVYLLANPEGYVDSDNVVDWLASKLSDVDYDDAPDVLEALTTTNGITAPLPMCGQATKAASTNTISTSLVRLVSRIDLYVNTNKFELTTAEIWNARKQAKLLSGSVVDLSSDDDDFVRYENKVVAPLDESPNQIEAALYAFPNNQVVTKKGDGVTTCLILEGKYDGSGTPSYYRLNIKPKTGSQVLKPNHRYKITITGVSGPGASSKEEAYKEESGDNFDYRIDEWESGDMEDGATDVYGNKLNVSSKQLVFSYLAGQTATINVLKKEGTTPPSPDEVTVTSSDPDNFIVSYDTENKQLTIETLNDNYGNTDLEAYATVKWGNDLEVRVNIIQLGATSTTGGLRVAPSALRLGTEGGSQNATLAVSGDLSDIAVSQISYQILNTDKDLDVEWCTINDKMSGSDGDGFAAQSVSGLFDFTIDIAAMTDASYSRSAVIYFTMKKANGEILNATMPVIQIPGGGSVNSKVGVYYFRWNGSGEGYKTQAIDDVSNYSDNGIWGAKTSELQGFPADQVGIGTRHIHFSVVENRIMKYRLSMPTDKQWRIIVKGEAVGRIEFTATSSATAPTNQQIYLAAKEDLDPAEGKSPWRGGSFAVEYEDGSQEEFFVHQYGVLGEMKNDYDYVYYGESEINGKLFFYGTRIIHNQIWLDRNLGATENGFYSNIATGVAGTNNPNNQGTWFASAAEAEEACPPGFRLPTAAEWKYIYDRLEFSNRGTNKPYDNTWYFALDSSPEFWPIPICGNGPGDPNGCYWFQTGFFTLGPAVSDRIWSDGFPSGDVGFSARCVRK